eukprot:TRINITY_DN2781_c1_g1_i2.p1 TRINITY_DN2781_c1_g1~~TRINITY_DN2781_c1_g1_i2.p1  ORF type:complete len:131 (+),score=4.59 TRINITY_DN2781_c1_g1_i2:346-738(+)
MREILEGGPKILIRQKEYKLLISFQIQIRDSLKLEKSREGEAEEAAFGQGANLLKVSCPPGDPISLLFLFQSFFKVIQLTCQPKLSSCVLQNFLMKLIVQKGIFPVQSIFFLVFIKAATKQNLCPYQKVY